MKVLKKAQDWAAQQVTCQGSAQSCGAVLEVEFSDLKRIHHEGTRGDPREHTAPWDEVFVTCPECERTIDIVGIPPHLVQRIPDQSYWRDR